MQNIFDHTYIRHAIIYHLFNNAPRLYLNHIRQSSFQPIIPTFAVVFFVFSSFAGRKNVQKKQFHKKEKSGQTEHNVGSSTSKI